MTALRRAWAATRVWAGRPPGDGERASDRLLMTPLAFLVFLARPRLAVRVISGARTLSAPEVVQHPPAPGP
jgi:hypothetical protein